MVEEIIIFRYGHRDVRDYRVTSHCALVSRAFGANKVIYSGEKDEGLENSISKVAKNWGGNFKIEYTNENIGE